MNEQFGKQKGCLGAGLFLGQHQQTEHNIMPGRKTELQPGETSRQRVKIPRLAMTV